MSLRIIVSVVLLSFAPFSLAEIEKIAANGKGGFHFYWWPKVAAPAGWKHDGDYSRHYGVNAFAPEGQSFANANTVLYARAVYKPRDPDIGSLRELISRDKESFREKIPDVKIEEARPLVSADGRELVSLSFIPKSRGNWERVCYLDEGEFYLIFVVSSRSSSGLDEAMDVYRSFVGSYAEDP